MPSATRKDNFLEYYKEGLIAITVGLATVATTVWDGAFGGCVGWMAKDNLEVFQKIFVSGCRIDF